MTTVALPKTFPKTYRVKSFGCQMNVYDGERMGELLDAQGMTAVGEREDAELVVLNTCTSANGRSTGSIRTSAGCAATMAACR